jgi:hypothetical protein
MLINHCNTCQDKKKHFENFQYASNNVNMTLDFDEELAKAHTYALNNYEPNTNNGFIFEYGANMYLSKRARGKIKTKMICNALVKIIGVKNTGTAEKPSKEYLFRVTITLHKITEERYLVPKQMVSISLFSQMLLNIAPFAEFSGSREDYADFRHMLISDAQKNHGGCEDHENDFISAHTSS